MRAELQNVDQRVAKIESTLQQLANVVVLTARQDEKLNAIERRVDRSEQAGPARHP
jgi:membrane protein YdbS with pleckstrin-like domain